MSAQLRYRFPTLHPCESVNEKEEGSVNDMEEGSVNDMEKGSETSCTTTLAETTTTLAETTTTLAETTSIEANEGYIVQTRKETGAKA